MSLWRIPVTWEECGVVCIEADTLSEAMEIAVEDCTIELPDGNYVDDSFALSIDDEEYIRLGYNGGREDN